MNWPACMPWLLYRLKDGPVQCTDNAC